MPPARLGPATVAAPQFPYLNDSSAVDLHCHCLPYFDDGPATMAEAVDMCRLLVRDGVGVVVATPHQLGRYHGCNMGLSVRRAVEALQCALVHQLIPLTVLPGAEVRMDERIPQLMREGEVLTLADRTYLLLEMPPDVHIDPLELIHCVARDGVRVIVAHPERHEWVTRWPELIRHWTEAGAALQINAGSLLGEYGDCVENAAWSLLSMSVPLVVATNAHNIRDRPPRLREAFHRIEKRVGKKVARQVCLEGPRQIMGLRSSPSGPRDGSARSAPQK